MKSVCVWDKLTLMTTHVLVHSVTGPVRVCPLQFRAVLLSMSARCDCFCSWRAAILFMCCSHYFVQQPICAQCGLFTVLLCRLTGATLRQLDSNPDSEAQAWTARTERNLCSWGKSSLRVWIQRDNSCGIADVTQLCVVMWIIQDAATQTEWSHRKPAGKVKVTHTAVQLLSVQLNSLCYTVGSWRFVRKIVFCRI